MSLIAEPGSIGPGGELTFTFVNEGDEPVSVGRGLRIERWDGESWTEYSNYGARAAAYGVQPGNRFEARDWPPPVQTNGEAEPTPPEGRYRALMSFRDDLGSKSSRAQELVVEFRVE